MINSGVIDAYKATRSTQYPLHSHIRLPLMDADITTLLDGRLKIFARSIKTWRKFYQINGLIEVQGPNEYDRAFAIKTPWLSVVFFRESQYYAN